MVNANDSYWLPNPKQPLEGYAGIIGCEQCERTLRTRMVYRYVLDRLAGTDGLASTTRSARRTLRGDRARQPRVRRASWPGRNGDLDTVCEAAERRRRLPGAAPRGTGTPTSAARHADLPGVLEAAPQGVPALWQVPFDPADPVNTPRDLNEANPQVVQAMKDAHRLPARRRTSRSTTTVGVAAGGRRRRRAGDPDRRRRGLRRQRQRGLEPQRRPRTSTRLYPVSYGSSHIQAVAFLPDGRLGGADDPDLRRVDGPDPPTSSSDQTRLFSQEKWVPFAVDVAAGRRRRGEHVRRARRLSAAARSPGDGDPGC